MLWIFLLAKIRSATAVALSYCCLRFAAYAGADAVDVIVGGGDGTDDVTMLEGKAADPMAPAPKPHASEGLFAFGFTRTSQQ